MSTATTTKKNTAATTTKKPAKPIVVTEKMRRDIDVAFRMTRFLSTVADEVKADRLLVPSLIDESSKRRRCLNIAAMERRFDWSLRELDNLLEQILEGVKGVQS